MQIVVFIVLVVLLVLVVGGILHSAGLANRDMEAMDKTDER